MQETLFVKEITSDCVFNEALVLKKTFWQCEDQNIMGLMIFLYTILFTVRSHVIKEIWFIIPILSMCSSVNVHSVRPSYIRRKPRWFPHSVIFAFSIKMSKDLKPTYRQNHSCVFNKKKTSCKYTWLFSLYAQYFKKMPYFVLINDFSWI